MRAWIIQACSSCCDEHTQIVGVHLSEEGAERAEKKWDEENPRNICWVDDYEVFE